MKKNIIVILVISLICFVFAKAENVVEKERALTDMSIEELYELEDSLVLALNEVFTKEATLSSDGEIIGTYVINPNSSKFHYPYCYSALQIEQGRTFVTCTASELVAKGLSPCGQCKPYKDEEKKKQ